MSSQYKLAIDRKLIFYKKPFFTGYIVCLSNDEGIRYYAITRTPCEEYLNMLNRNLSSHNKTGYPPYHSYFEILIGTGVKIEVVKVIKFQMGCYEHTSRELGFFIDNNECINKNTKKNFKSVENRSPIDIITG